MCFLTPRALGLVLALPPRALTLGVGVGTVLALVMTPCTPRLVRTLTPCSPSLVLTCLVPAW